MEDFNLKYIKKQLKIIMEGWRNVHSITPIHEHLGMSEQEYRDYRVNDVIPERMMTKRRICNVEGCGGRMRPTKKMHDADWVPNPSYRIFQCCRCGNETPWLDKPVPTFIFGELHHIGDLQCSGLSMMSDLCFYRKEIKRRRTK